MIKIRYLDLPTGLHVRTEAEGADTIVYLLPGLTTAQRRAALHGARSSARMGHGPQLPAVGLACAVAADRVRTTVRNGAAAMRVHPALLIPPVVIMVSAALAYLLLASVSVTYRPPGAGSGAEPNPVSQGIGVPGAPDEPAARRGRATHGPPGDVHPGAPDPSPGSPPLRPRPLFPSAPSGYQTPSPSRSPTWPAPDPSPSPDPPVLPSPPPPGTPSPSPAPSGGGTGGGGCMTIGQWGICIRL